MRTNRRTRRLGCAATLAVLLLSGCALPEQLTEQLQEIGLAPAPADDPTLRPDLAQGVKVRPVSGERRMVEVARLRTQPSVDAGIVRTMDIGDRVALAGKVEGYSWYLVTLPDGQAGYLHGTSITAADEGGTTVAREGSTFGGYARRDGGGGMAGSGGGAGGGGSAGGGGGGHTGNAGSAL